MYHKQDVLEGIVKNTMVDSVNSLWFGCNIYCSLGAKDDGNQLLPLNFYVLECVGIVFVETIQKRSRVDHTTVKLHSFFFTNLLMIVSIFVVRAFISNS